MRRADVFVNDILAGVLMEFDDGRFGFEYNETYDGDPVSLTLPVSEKKFSFDTFPPFFDGLLPEGTQLDGLLRQRKIDRNDFFAQLLAVGQDMVGAVTVKASAA